MRLDSNGTLKKQAAAAKVQAERLNSAFEQTRVSGLFETHVRPWVVSHARLAKPLFATFVAAALTALLVASLPHDDALPHWPAQAWGWTFCVCILGALAVVRIAGAVHERLRECAPRLGLGSIFVGALLALLAATTLPACTFYWDALPSVISQRPFSVFAVGAGVGSTVLAGAAWQCEELPRTISPRLLRTLVSFALLMIAGLVWITALWTVMDPSLADTPAGLRQCLLPAAFASTWALGYVAILQATESTDPPALQKDQVRFPTMQDVLPLEAQWLNHRRGAVGLTPNPIPGEAPDRLVGLALSGGGIRSATISLGFMQALASEPFGSGTFFRHIDYLSSVSGGGWAAGAVTARTAFAGPPKRHTGAQPGSRANDPNDGLDLASSDAWERLARTLRCRSDYLVPGGPGLTAGTVRPVLIVLVGAALNLVSLWAGFATLVGILVRSERNHGAILRALRWFESWFPLDLFVLKGRLGHEFYTVNVVAVAFVASTMLLALGIACLIAGMILLQAKLREYGGWMAAVGFVPGVPLGIAVLALHKSQWVTYALVGFVASIALALYLKEKASQLRIASAVGALLATEGALVKIWPDIEGASAPFTKWWGAKVEGCLMWHVDTLTSHGPGGLILATGALAFCCLLLGFVVSRNVTGLHVFWSTQISNAYLRRGEGRLRDSDDPAHWPLAALRPSAATLGGAAPRKATGWDPRNAGGPERGAPLHIISASVNIPGSTNEVYRKRGTAHFEYSPYAIGGPATGWVDADRYAGRVTLAGAIATSAAAVNSQGGSAIPRWARALLGALNVGLGIWIRNPRLGRDPHSIRFRIWPHFWAGYTLKDLFGLNNEFDSLVFVSDGGHHDNLGLSALVERGCGFILCLDAGHDPERNFCDLAQVARFLQIDRGWRLRPGDSPLQPLRPKKFDGDFNDRVSKSPVALFTLTRDSGETIHVAYVKSSLLDAVPVEVRHYADANPLFPHESTADQFFSEAQFEAYRLLGGALARRTLARLAKSLEWTLEGAAPRAGRTPSVSADGGIH